jgi:hypothetical protein
MSDSQDKLKMEGEWARVAIGNARDNWIEGGAAQYQEYHGNGGNNVFKGGSGIDVFKIRKGEGNDTILDFSNVPGDTDKVYLDGFHFSHFDDVVPFLKQVGEDVVLQLDADQGLKFANLTIDQLAAEQFAFFNTTTAPSPVAGAIPTESDQGLAAPPPVVPPEFSAEPELDSVSQPEPEQAAPVLAKPDEAVSELPEPIEEVEEAAGEAERPSDVGGEAVVDKTSVDAAPDTGAGRSPANWDEFVADFADFDKRGPSSDGWSKIADRFAGKADIFAKKAGIVEKMLAKKAVFEGNDDPFEFSARSASEREMSKAFKGNGFEAGNSTLDFGSRRMEAMNDRVAALQDKWISSEAQKFQNLNMGDFDWNKSFAEGIAEQAVQQSAFDFA